MSTSEEESSSQALWTTGEESSPVSFNSLFAPMRRAVTRISIEHSVVCTVYDIHRKERQNSYDTPTLYQLQVLPGP